MAGNYTVEEIESLRDFLIPHQYISDFPFDVQNDDALRIIEACDNYQNDYAVMIKKFPILLSMLTVPFEDLPLHVNDNIVIDRILAKWRLKIGR